MNVLMITVDGLRASALGAYGNTSFETPGFDRLASESVVADWCHAGSVELRDIYRALWYGVHPQRPKDFSSGHPSIAQLFAEGGYHTTLLGDQPNLADLSGTNDFDEIEWLEPEVATPAKSIGTTHFAALMSRLGQLIDSPSEEISSAEKQTPQFIWLHTQGMFGPWDAPLDLRALAVEEGDPEPYNGTDSPCLMAESGFDPDERLPYLFSYAAQVQTLDACIGALLEMLDGKVSVCVLGLRGFPLGERGMIGGIDLRLPATQLHVPMMFRTADRRGRLQRIGQLAEQTDLQPTLCELARLEAPNSEGANLLSIAEYQQTPWRDHSIAISAKTKAIRTPSWCLRGAELYVRPDDAIEVNDVANLRSDIAAQLQQAITDFERRCEVGEPLCEDSLPEALTAPVE